MRVKNLLKTALRIDVVAGLGSLSRCTEAQGEGDGSGEEGRLWLWLWWIVKSEVQWPMLSTVSHQGPPRTPEYMIGPQRTLLNDTLYSRFD